MSGSIPDGQRCIICYVHARSGVIAHLRTCADYVPPRPTATRVNARDALLRLARR